MSEAMAGVYRINLGAGLFYIGSAVNLRNRERAHRSDLRNGKHCNPVVQNSFNKYGVFEFTVLERCPVDEVIAREQVLLDTHFADPSCANLAPTAGSRLGSKHSPETRAKMSASQQNRAPVSEETRAKLSAAARNRPPLSAEHRAKLSAAMTGKKLGPYSAQRRANMSAGAKTAKRGTRGPLSPEHRANLSAALKGKKLAPFTAEHRANMSAASKAQWARRKALAS